MMKYTTLLFDSDDTLLDFKAAEKAALEKAMKQCGLPFNNSLHILYSNWNKAFWEAYERGEIQKSDIFVGRFNSFLAEAGISYDAEKLSKAYEHRLGFEHQPITNAIELCRALQPHYKMHIVTNGNLNIQLPRLKDSGLISFFSKVFVSEQVGYSKPHKEFFDYVLNHIEETDKGKILIIGDSISSDILGGLNAGIDTCHFNPKGEATCANPTYTVKSYQELKELLLNNQRNLRG